MKKCTLLFIAFFMFAGPAIAQTKLTMGTMNWEPYYGEKLENGGVLSAVAKAAFEKVGYSADIQFMDWKRAVGMTKAGKIDALFGCYYSDERAKLMSISDSIGEAELVFFSKKGAGISFKSLEDLKQYKIGTVKGQVYSKDFDGADYLNKEEVDKLEINFKKLLKGRIDLIIGSKLAILDQFNNSFPQDSGGLEPLKPALQTNSLHVGFSRKNGDYEKITADFNKGLKMIRDEGLYTEIMKQYGF